MSEPRDAAMSVVEAIAGRRSVRRFLPDRVPEVTIRDVLQRAARAASGVNMQPWHVHIVTGAARDRLGVAACKAIETGKATLEYPYLPEIIAEPYLSRRRKVGYDLYSCYGIARDDYPARRAAMLRNFDFFGAPIGLFLTMDRAMSQGAWLDCGMFLQNVMLLARFFGLETCAQQAWCDVGNVVHDELGIADDHILLTGMAIGFVDENAPVNSLITERADIDRFSQWHDE